MAKRGKNEAPNSGKDIEELVNDLMHFEIIMMRYSGNSLLYSCKNKYSLIIIFNNCSLLHLLQNNCKYHAQKLHIAAQKTNSLQCLK